MSATVDTRKVRDNYRDYEWVNPHEVAFHTGKSVDTIYAWMKQGKFPIRSSNYKYRLHGPSVWRFVDGEFGASIPSIIHSTA